MEAVSVEKSFAHCPTGLPGMFGSEMLTAVDMTPD